MGKNSSSTPRGILKNPTVRPEAVAPITSNSDLAYHISRFLRERQARGLTDGTLEYYSDKLKIFSRYCEARKVGRMADLSVDFIIDYINEQAKTHNLGGNHALFRALKAFLRWYDQNNKDPNWQNPIAKIKAPKKSDEKLEAADLDTIRAMLDVCNRRTMLGARDYCWLLVLLDTGVRADELLHIEVEDVHLDTYSIHIRKGKGRKERDVYVGRKTAAALRAYLKLHPTGSGALYVVEGPSGARLSYSGLRNRKDDLANAAGVTPPKIHAFRRLFALTMKRSGVDLLTIGRILGHTDKYVISRYINIDDTDAVEAHKGGGPVDHAL